MNRRLICFFFCVTIALGQSPVKKKAVPAPAPPSPVITDELTAYLLPIELQKETRDLQLDYSELETANQTMQVQIEKNKQKQRDVTAAIQKIWYDYAIAKQIDLKLWEPDPKALKFAKKKATK